MTPVQNLFIANRSSFEGDKGPLSPAGLVDTLKGPGPCTVFAPTNEAFAALPAITVDTLLKPENKGKLTSVLTYHVVAGRRTFDCVDPTPARPQGSIKFFGRGPELQTALQNCLEF